MRRIRLDFPLTEAQSQAHACAQQIPDLKRRRVRGLGSRPACSSTGSSTAAGCYFNRAPSNLFRLSPQAPARRRASRRRSTTGRWKRPIPTIAKVRDAGAANRQDQRRAAPRARHAVDHGRTRRRAGRRDGPRLDPVPACDAGPAGRHPLSSRAIPRSTPSRPNRRCSGPSIWRSRREPGKPTKFSITYELTIFGQDHRDRSRTRSCAVEPTRGARAVHGRAAAAHRVHRRHARVLARGRRRRDAIRIGSRRSCSPPSIAFPGPARANTRRSPTSATTRCTPATPTAASRRCC